DYNQNSRNILSLLTQKRLNSEKKDFSVNHGLLNPKMDLEGYIDKYLSEYYYRSMRQIFRVLASAKLYHKIQVGQKRYRNLPCSFEADHHPELSFKLRRKGKQLTVAIFYKLKDKHYGESDIKCFRFLVCRRDNYYL